MVLMVMIARATDGLPLAASLQDDEQVGTGQLILCSHDTRNIFFIASHHGMHFAGVVMVVSGVAVILGVELTGRRKSVGVSSYQP